MTIDKVLKTISTLNVRALNEETLYNSGHNRKSWKGVDILVKNTSKVSFEAASGRTYLNEIKIDNTTKIFVISAYTPNTRGN